MKRAPSPARRRARSARLRASAPLRAPDRLAPLGATLALLVLAGCGSSGGSGTSAAPASVVPASAPLYVEATVRPEGSLESNALALGRSLTGQRDPYLRLVSLLQAPGAPPLDFSREVAPWLGQHAGAFVTALGSSSASALAQSLLQKGLLGGGGSGGGALPFGSGLAQGALVLDTSDAGKARAFVESQAKRASARSVTYNGVSYQQTARGVAYALVGRMVVVGSEAGVHGVIDTQRGGSALVHAPDYARLIAAAPSGVLAHLYSNPGTAPASGASANLAQLLTGAHPANLSLVPSASALAIDADLLPAASSTAPGGLLSAGGGGAQAFGELPEDSWLALGLGNVGATLGEDVRGLSELASLGAAGGEPASSTISLSGLLEGLLTPLGDLGAPTAQARRDYTSWMGPAGAFASGSGLLELKAAAVIASTDPALSRAAVGKLAAQLHASGASTTPLTIAGTDAAVGARVKGVPLMLVIADGRTSNGQTKFVLGLGEASVLAALNPPGTLSASTAAKSAATTLGEGLQPNLLVQFPTLLSVLEGVGLTEDPSLSGALPALRAATTLYGGVGSLGGGVQRVRVVLGVRPAA